MQVEGMSVPYSDQDKKLKEGVDRTMMDLQTAYKAVLLKQMFEEELRDWKGQAEQFLKKGVLKASTIHHCVIAVILLYVLSFLAIDYFFITNDANVFLFKEYFGLFGTAFGGLIAMILFIYNHIKQFINRLIGKKDRHHLQCLEHIKATEMNHETVTTALREKCGYPKEYQRKEVLETMIMFIKQGRAKSAEEAMRIIRNDFSYMLN